MLKKIERPKIGVLFITTPRFKNLGEDTQGGVYSKRKEVESKQLLDRIDFADIIFPGVIYTREDVKKAINIFVSEDVDMVFAHFLSWSDDFAFIRFLRDMAPVPLFFGGLIRDELGFDDSLSEDRFVEFLAAGGLVGSLEGSGSFKRFARPMSYSVFGSAGDVFLKLKMFAEVASVRKCLKQATFGLLPSFNEVMWSTYIDPYLLFQKVGPELRFLSVGELIDEIEQTSKEKTKAAVNRILSGYKTDGEIDVEKMYASVKASLALESLARANNIELMVLNDVDKTLLTTVGLRPGFTPCPDTDDVLVVPEGDIGAGVACYLLAKLTGRVVNYIEPFYINSTDGTFHAGHAGPNDYTDPDANTVLSTDTRFAKSGYKYAGAPFAWTTFSPGKKTMLHLSQSQGNFKMVCTVVECLPTEHFLAGYSHGVFKFKSLSDKQFTELMKIGVTQHYAITDGDYIEQLKMFADIMGFECHLLT